MDEFERKIANALRADEAERYEKLDSEMPPWEMLVETLRGPNWWLNVICGVWTLVFFVAAIWCIVRFFQAGTTEQMLPWGFGGLLFFTMVGFLKLWYLMEIQRHSIIREVKRAELQIASLSRSLRGTD